MEVAQPEAPEIDEEEIKQRILEPYLEDIRYAENISARNGELEGQLANLL